MRRPVATRRTRTARTSRAPRATLALTATAALLLAGVAACASSKPATGDTAAGDAIGLRPNIQVPAGKPDGKLGVKVKIQGDGPKVTDGSVLVLQFGAKLWRGGTDLGSSYDKGQHPVVQVEGENQGQNQMLEGWVQGLKGQAAGSRVELTVPPALAFGPKGSTDGKVTINGTDTLIFDIDIIGVYPSPQADIPAGTGVLNDPSLPSVATTVGASDPKITIPAGKQPPKEAVYKPVIVGKGPQVKQGQTVVVQYEGLVWRTGQIFDSTFSKSKELFPTQIGVGAVVPGWDEGLVGQTVGSRVLLVVPPDKGYGPQGQPDAGIKGTDTMVFAVDILDAR